MPATAADAPLGALRVAQYTPSGSSPATILGVAFTEVCRLGTPITVDALHEATTNIVVRLRSDGASPERVIVAVKEALTRYGGSHVPPSLNAPAGCAGVLGERESATYRRVFAWCLDALYGPAVMGPRAASPARGPAFPPII